MSIILIYIGGYNGYLEFNNDNRLNVKSITGKTSNSPTYVERLKKGKSNGGARICDIVINGTQL